MRAAADALRVRAARGAIPGAAERRRLLAGGALVALVAGWFVFGSAAGLVAAAARPRCAARGCSRRGASVTARAVEAGAADIAIALADALSGGHSLRGAIVSAARSLTGPPGHELRRVAAELELGAAHR